MGFRFRRSIKLFPGVRLNLSKSGVSTSVGVPGATVNVGRRGVRRTVGLPGTGISYSSTAGTAGTQGGTSWLSWLVAIVFGAVCFAVVLASR